MKELELGIERPVGLSVLSPSRVLSRLSSVVIVSTAVPHADEKAVEARGVGRRVLLDHAAC